MVKKRKKIMIFYKKYVSLPHEEISQYNGVIV